MAFALKLLWRIVQTVDLMIQQVDALVIAQTMPLMANASVKVMYNTL